MNGLPSTPQRFSYIIRYTAAKLTITAGADISSVKTVLGHGSVGSTEVYAKVGLDKKIEAMNLTNGIF